MGIKVLIVEDRDIRYKPLFKTLQRGLPMEAFQFVRASTITAALEVLGQDWDVILMDYHMGKRADAEDGTQVCDGADLIAYRRKLESAAPEGKRAQIIGIAGDPVNGGRLEAAGGDLNCCGGRPFRQLLVKYLREWLPEETDGSKDEN